MGDGLATAFAAMIGGPANTTYGENTSVVGMTRVASVYVTGGAAVIAIILSFVNLFTTLVASIPAPVMGGMSIILYGFIAANGLKVLIDNRVNLGSMRNIIIVASMLVIGLGNAKINFSSFSIYGLSLAALVGILLNFILPQEKETV
jgi:uracil permease